MEEFELGAFIFGFILGASLTALALKGKLNGFKDLFVGVYNKLFKRGGNK